MILQVWIIKFGNSTIVQTANVVVSLGALEISQSSDRNDSSVCLKISQIISREVVFPKWKCRHPYSCYEVHKIRFDKSFSCAHHRAGKYAHGKNSCNWTTKIVLIQYLLIIWVNLESTKKDKIIFYDYKILLNSIWYSHFWRPRQSFVRSLVWIYVINKITSF